MLDLEHEFFRPLSRRVVVTVIIVFWSGFEFLAGSPFFGVLFAGLGIWCGWSFFGPKSVVYDSAGSKLRKPGDE